MPETKRFPLIDAESIRRIRKPEPGFRCPVEFGVIERGLKATGRARCRSCGQKIVKGVEEIRFFWDFNGCGSWTAVEVHIHVSPCTEGGL